MRVKLMVPINRHNQYIKYYNNDRIKLRLDGKSPAQYRALQISNH